MNVSKGSAKKLKLLWKAAPWILVIILIISAIILGGIVSKKRADIEAKRKEGADNLKPSINVVIQKIVPVIITDRINLPAIVNPYEDLMVNAEVEGLVLEIYVDEGDIVKKGDIILKIDDVDYRNRLKNINAAYKLASITNERYKKLRVVNDITQAQLDESEARLLELDANLADAKLNLERCKIKAPIAGVVNSLPAKIGLLLSRSDAIAQIVDLTKIKVKVGIPESDVIAIRDVAECKLTIEALNNLEVTGKRIFLSVQPGSIARLYTLTLLVDNPDRTILPGMFCRVDVVKKVYESSVVVPLYSIITREKDRYVYVEKDGKAHLSKVTLGVMEGWKVLVTQGLEPGDNLIIVGHRNLDDQQSVNVLKEVQDPNEIFQ